MTAGWSGTTMESEILNVSSPRIDFWAEGLCWLSRGVLTPLGCPFFFKRRPFVGWFLETSYVTPGHLVNEEAQLGFLKIGEGDFLFCFIGVGNYLVFRLFWKLWSSDLFLSWGADFCVGRVNKCIQSLWVNNLFESFFFCLHEFFQVDYIRSFKGRKNCFGHFE